MLVARIIRSILQRPFPLGDLVDDCQKFIDNPPMPGNVTQSMANVVGYSGVSLLEYWRRNFIEDLKAVANESTWRLQRAKLLEIMFREETWSAVHKVAGEIEDIRVWGHVVQGVFPGDKQEHWSAYLFQRWLLAILTSTGLEVLGRKSFRLGKDEEMLKELFFSIETDVRAMEFGFQRIILKTKDEKDLEWIEAVEEEIVGPLLQEHRVLLTVIKEAATRGPVASKVFGDIADEYERLNKKRDQVGQAIKSNDFSSLLEPTANDSAATA